MRSNYANRSARRLSANLPMDNQSRRFRSRRQPRRRPRSGYLYVSVLLTTLLVASLATAGLQILAIRRSIEYAGDAEIIARCHAVSASQFAIDAINADANWRAFGSGHWHTVPPASVRQGPGIDSIAMQWMVRDTDGNLNDADSTLILRGRSQIAMATAMAVQVEQMLLQQSTQWSSTTPMIDTDGFANPIDYEFKKDSSGAAWFKLGDLMPPGAATFEIQSVELFLRVRDDRGKMEVNLYSEHTNGKPDEKLAEGEINLSGFPDSWRWVEVPITGDDIELGRDEPFFIAVELTDKKAEVEVKLFDGDDVPGEHYGIAAAKKKKGWHSPSFGRTLRCRINGRYEQTHFSVAPQSRFRCVDQ